MVQENEQGRKKKAGMGKSGKQEEILRSGRWEFGRKARPPCMRPLRIPDFRRLLFGAGGSRRLKGEQEERGETADL